jgi:hypothetical protein
VRIGPRRIHAQRLHSIPRERFDLIAHGGELAVSARGVVAGVEEERHVAPGQQVT